jgi:cobalamin biosynthesis protein CobD/CbiB
MCGALSAVGRGSVLIAVELLLMALFVVLFAPDTPIGKSLRVMLIDAPAKTLSRATPRKVIIGLIVFLALVIFIISAPELVAIMGLSDLSIYLDITIISILMNTAIRLKSVLAYAIRLVRGIATRDIPQRKRARSRNRLSHPRRPKSPPSDDEGGAEWGWAFT